MWYLITFEPQDFVKVTTIEGGVDTKLIGVDNGQRHFNVTQQSKRFEIEVLDDMPSGDELTSLCEINPVGFIMLNHASVLLRWNQELSELRKKLMRVFSKYDKYVIVPVTEIVDSNYLPKENINSYLAATKK